jgi:transcriptional regulator with XRE-family HTH domain
MRCEACGVAVKRWSSSSFCPTCHTVSGELLTPPARRTTSAMWLWASPDARAALATGQLSIMVRAYRTATGTSQRRLADVLGYDPTYISMIETGRREVADVHARLRIARLLGLPAHALGVADPDDADYTAMLQFGQSTLRLAVLARQAGHGAEAVNELWPLVTRLETRAADGHVERDVMHMLALARAELGVSLGYVLPDERLVSAARWTGRALRLAEQLNDPRLLAFTLRVHGNELRKIHRPVAAMARLRHAADLTAPAEQGQLLIQLARAAGDLATGDVFDETITAAHRHLDRGLATGMVNEYALREVHARGLLATGRPDRAAALVARTGTPATAAPQWRAIMQVTVGEIALVLADSLRASAAFTDAITLAEAHRLPQQIQRIVRKTARTLPAVNEQARLALSRLRVPSPVQH